MSFASVLPINTSVSVNSSCTEQLMVDKQQKQPQVLQYIDGRCNCNALSCTVLSTVKCCNSVNSTIKTTSSTTFCTTSSGTTLVSENNSCKTTHLNGANLLNNLDGNLLHFNVNINNNLNNCSNSINNSQLKSVNKFNKNITTIISECFNSSKCIISDIERNFGAFLVWSLSFKRGKWCNSNNVHSVFGLLFGLLLLLCTDSAIARPNSSVVSSTGIVAAPLTESSVSI